MVIIRLQRRGAKKDYHHRIVVMEKKDRQQGKAMEILGHYNPAFEPETFELKEDRFKFWIQNGAQVSESVAKLAKRFKKISVASL